MRFKFHQKNIDSTSMTCKIFKLQSPKYFSVTGRFDTKQKIAFYLKKSSRRRSLTSSQGSVERGNLRTEADGRWRGGGEYCTTVACQPVTVKRIIGIVFCTLVVFWSVCVCVSTLLSLTLSSLWLSVIDCMFLYVHKTFLLCMEPGLLQLNIDMVWLF